MERNLKGLTLDMSSAAYTRMQYLPVATPLLRIWLTHASCRVYWMNLVPREVGTRLFEIGVVMSIINAVYHS